MTSPSATGFRPRQLSLPSREVSAGVLLGAIGGLGAAIAPIGVLGVVAGTLLLGGLVLLGARSARAFLGALAALLVVYAFLARGGAYIGIAPIYVSEVVLVMGAVALLLNLRRVRLGAVELLLIAFMIWGAARTIPYIGAYGLDAPRDGVTWEYGLFALVVATTVVRLDFLRIVRGYRWFVAAFVILMPLIAVGTRVFDSVIPRWPNTPLGGVTIVFFNNGHAGVHAAGVAAFVLLGLYTLRRRAVLPEPLVWIGWLVTVAIVGSLNRAAMLAAFSSGLAAGVVRSAGRLTAPLVVAPLLVATLLLLNPVVDLGTTRKVSFDQLVANVSSVFGSSEDRDLEGTAAWRIAWWNKIVGYTVEGPYFWDGKGYGINLADSDGFQVNWDGSLRAPHNGHLEILARSGVPGFVLWVALQAAYAVALLRGIWAARRAGRPFWVRVQAWLFIYWLAAMINLSFDPYLEGPHGGIWFWSLMGLGLAATRVWRTREVEPAIEPEPLEPAAAPAISIRPAATAAAVGE